MRLNREEGEEREKTRQEGREKGKTAQRHMPVECGDDEGLDSRSEMKGYGSGWDESRWCMGKCVDSLPSTRH